MTVENNNNDSPRRKFLKLGLMTGGAVLAGLGIQKSLVADEDITKRCARLIIKEKAPSFLTLSNGINRFENETTIPKKKKGIQ